MCEYNVPLIVTFHTLPTGGSSVFSYKVKQTGWTQIFFNQTKGFKVIPGIYDIKISDVGGLYPTRKYVPGDSVLLLDRLMLTLFENWLLNVDYIILCHYTNKV